jgi:isoamylase
MNGHHDLVEFTLPEVTGGGEWSLKMDTNLPTLPDDNVLFAPGNTYGVTGRSVLVFMLAMDKSS